MGELEAISKKIRKNDTLCIIVLILILSVMIGIMVGSYRKLESQKGEGLKGVVESIWYGEGGPK